MKFAFHIRQPFTKTMNLAAALQAGAKCYGDDVRIIEGFNGIEDVDGLILFGIGGDSRSYWDAYREAGKRTIFLDKGYSRMPYFRVAVDGFNPYSFISRKKCPPGRLHSLGHSFNALQPKGEFVLLDGASNKYCLWSGLGDWIEWGQHMVECIRNVTDRPIIYRPRPSHNGAVAVRGATLSTDPLADDLAKAAVVVSHGGNIAWDAAQAGVPIFCINEFSFAAPIAELDWICLGMPRGVSKERVEKWAANVAYCQYTISEFASGLGWAHIKSELGGGFDED